MKLKYVNSAFFGTLVLLFVLLVFITYDPHLQTTNILLNFLVEKHLWLMFGMVLVVGGFGYYLSYTLTEALHDKEETNQAVMYFFMQTLRKDERVIVRELLKGPTTQAKLSEIEGLTRVKVHRALQKLRKQGIIVLKSSGKTKHVSLVESLISKE